MDNDVVHLVTRYREGGCIEAKEEEVELAMSQVLFGDRCR